MPEHTPGPRIALIAHVTQLLTREFSERGLHRAQEDILDVDVLALKFTARLVAAHDEDGRDIEPPRSHEMSGRGFVAGRKADHAIELRPSTAISMSFTIRSRDARM